MATFKAPRPQHASTAPAASAGPSRSSMPLRPPTYISSSGAAAGPSIPPHSGPPGTFAPGTKVQVGNHRVIIDRYLSEGGFAHVYVVSVPVGSGKDGQQVRSEKAVLKRVAVPDKETLAEMKTEVETMKRLKGHRHIVTYIDSHASQLKGGGFEVFLLMEYCAGGGLIDFMNTRLQHRLTEPEILQLFSDVAEGVACMHYLKPPLLHRDLKVENVLISSTPSGRKLYKLCDFGSAAPPRPAATNAHEGRLIEDDVQRHTTLQYRSPEMVDVYRKRPIDEKSDIWALGVLLYKLCYYTTPFEEKGQMAILTASFKYPGYPQFSDNLKKLIAMMLTENPNQRPNIYQVVREVCRMRGTEVPIKDIYASRTESEARRNRELPPAPGQRDHSPMIGAFEAAPVQEVRAMPEVTPMRRGRPTTTAATASPASSSQQRQAARSGYSPQPRTDGDPFAALDSKHQPTRAAAADELAARFPSLDEFSILHDKGARFQADSATSDRTNSLSKRVTAALADEAFARAAPPAQSAPSSRPRSPQRGRGPPEPAAAGLYKIPSESAASTKRAGMVSVGTMTYDPPSPPVETKKPERTAIWRVPSSHSRSRQAAANVEAVHGERTPLRDDYAVAPYRDEVSPVRSSSSSRPSLEGSRPTGLQVAPPPTHRSRSAHSRSRASLDIMREGFGLGTSHDRRSSSRGKLSRSSSHQHSKMPHLGIHHGHHADRHRDPSPADESPIASNVDFLRSMEEEDHRANSHKRTSSFGLNLKRSSMPSVSRNILGSRIGDAFRRFESGTGSRSGSGSHNHSHTLSTVAGSDMASSQASDDEAILRNGDAHVDHSKNYADGHDDDDDNNDNNNELAIMETEDLSPEMRRELERQRLSQEERRVAEAGAAYRQGLLSGKAGGGSGSNRAYMIQNRVKSLLDESSKISPTRTAEGYGRYTDQDKAVAASSSAAAAAAAAAAPLVTSPPSTSSTFPTQASSSVNAVSASAPPALRRSEPPTATAVLTSPPPSSSASTSAAARPSPVRPNAPPKPTALRTGSTLAAKPSAGKPTDWDSDAQINDFSKRYPRLPLEMVEADISGAGARRK